MAPEDETDALWRRYERSVQTLLSLLDRGAEVLHDQRIEGRLSLAKRQVDVWVRGTLVGLQITVAIECKRHRRVVDVGIIDEFVGKLLDLGADRGIVYSYSGFTNAAVARSVGARHPHVMAVALQTPEIVTELRGAPGYPADLLHQEVAPQWIEELDRDAFADFLRDGRWSKYWS